MERAPADSTPAMLDLDGLAALVATLREAGYRVIGPTRRDGAILYEEIAAAAELPAGWTELQDAGRYRLERREDEARFGYPVGPHSWKRYLLPPRVRLWSARRDNGAVAVMEEPPPEQPLALLGVRSCDLHAIAVQDRVFLEGAYVDRDYAARREPTFLVAVQCGVPGGTCFCASLGTGPRAAAGFDLALTELLDDGAHRFVVEVGSERGAEVLAALPTHAAGDADVDAALRVTDEAAESMGRELDAFDLRDLLARNLEHPRWEQVAERCLTCGNCTLVCPTCFCTSVEDVNVLADGGAERWRRWDSCYSVDYSYIHGGAVRPSSRARYRQWLTHKFGTWHDQFGTSGCVGCGRCITWCPVGIDVTEELAAIRATDGQEGQEVDHAHA